ncbi:STAS domain-containing protein [Actinomadura mexicana]|uniref:Anti-sigma factor antagonist n=1 Tax=Actinomadura mexicana TaxID=134959 RepID=A0A238XB00_9ACTN|nr:STAS domain-containing protein [Actinomadura mexicana]SNR55514.1 anti-anti-sigma factor [Actinomadura mexicana]
MIDDTGGRPPSTPEERLSVHCQAQPGDGVLVAGVAGEIDSATAGLLREWVISAAVPVSAPRLVLDLDGVTFCDAAGLGALVAIRNAVRARGGDLVLARPPDMCHQILRRTGLDRHIHIAATLDRAIALLTS